MFRRIYAGDIGEPVRKVDYEPMPDDIPVPEVVPAPAPAEPAKTPERETVPA